MRRATLGIAAAVLFSTGLFAQSSPAFEVASVRQHKGTDVFRSGPLIVSGPLIRLEGYTVFGLVMDAWNLKAWQLSFGSVARPDDIYNTMYDVTARAPGEGVPSIESVRAMLQTLLADRFRLRVHRDTREMPVYALVVAKKGPRLKRSSGGSPCSTHLALASDGRNDEETFSNCPVERLADRLNIGNRPVIDRTGLSGQYDFRLVSIPEYRSRGGSDPADIDPVTAVGELGLKLVPQKAQVEILTVDHLEKPTKN